jgi:hypothetical protein
MTSCRAADPPRSGSGPEANGRQCRPFPFLTEALRNAGVGFDRPVGVTQIAPEDETKFFSQM